MLKQILTSTFQIIIPFQNIKMGSEICKADEVSPGFQDPEKGEGYAKEPKEKIVATTMPPQNSHEQSVNHEMFAESNAQANGQIALKLNLGKKKEKVFEKIKMSSEPRIAKLDFGAMQVVRKEDKRKRINLYELEVPFNIIFLTISPTLKHTINAIGKDMFKKHQEKGGQGWRLHKNGFYINYLAKKLTAILTENIYFQGELQDGDRIYPKAEGILLNQTGRYEGSFERGRANGKGTFEDHTKGAMYKGFWKDGRLIDGSIEADEYYFKGKIQDNMAHGQGQIFFKHQQISYVGRFKKGVYYDKKATYETKDYVYEGCFVNGQKNGNGTLVEKERDYRDRRVKYRPPTQYEGEWAKDIYLNKEAIQADYQIENEGQEALKPQPFIQAETFEEEHLPQAKLRVQAALPEDDDEQEEKPTPKYVWVQAPSQHHRHKEEDQQNSQVF